MQERKSVGGKVSTLDREKNICKKDNAIFSFSKTTMREVSNLCFATQRLLNENYADEENLFRTFDRVCVLRNTTRSNIRSIPISAACSQPQRSHLPVRMVWQKNTLQRTIRFDLDGRRTLLHIQSTQQYRNVFETETAKQIPTARQQSSTGSESP